MSELAALLTDSDAPGDAPLVFWRDRTYTRGEIAAAAAALTQQLRRGGVAEGNAVSALVPSEPIGVVMLFGIWGAGAVCAPLNPRLPEPELDRLIADVRPAAVVKPAHEPGSLRAQVLSRTGDPRAYDADVALIMTPSGTHGPPKRGLIGDDEG